MENLKGLGEPQEFWDYFFQISKIPRCSRKEELIRAFIEKEALKFKFEHQTDQTGNIVVRVPPQTSMESEPLRIVLQSHMDMVCEKNKEIDHDFSKDPLRLKVIDIDNEKWLTAEGTTLGADNGVGIAYQLAIMKKIFNGELDFGSLHLDMLFTVDEEKGLTGALKIDRNLIKGKYLINIDSEEDDEFTIGCAGGRVFKVEIKDERVSIEKIKDQITPLKLDVMGLIGGHSGSDIIKRRGNANKILAEIMWKLNKEFTIYLSTINGGNLSNAITREAHAIFYVKKEESKNIKEKIEFYSPYIKSSFDGIDPSLTIVCEEYQEKLNHPIIANDLKDKLLDLFYLMPNGPLSIHPKNPKLVHTSDNFAVIKTKPNSIKIKISTRSLTEYGKEVIYEKIITLFNAFNFEKDLTIKTDYPSWDPDFNSLLTSKAREIYKELFDQDVNIKAIHAGLECAYFSKYYPNMQMISLGPDIKGGHSPDERLRIRSTEKIWKFLVTLLKNLN
ncbi:MAG: beta-Ala-His dipeptidase [Promethearchaeota archaeon]